MRVLVLNAGSSSLKFALHDIARTEDELIRGGFDRFDGSGCDLALVDAQGRQTRRVPRGDIAAAVASVPGLLAARGLGAIDAIGHRIAHGGADFAGPALLDAPTLERIAALIPLAPLHNPANLATVRQAQALWPDIPQVGVFDTSFHLTMPARASTYAVPDAWRAAGLRRYGFHGTSHRYVAGRAAQALGRPVEQLRIITAHLGNGASICAVGWGKSLDTSMGLTPVEGLVMGTRAGDLDPGAFGFLHRQLGLDIDQIEAALNADSGLKGLCGLSDMRAVDERAHAGDAAAQLALSVYAYRVRKYIGAYAAAMGGVDAIVFTGGVGENAAGMRARICDGLSFMGVVLDPDRNRDVRLADGAAPQIQDAGAGVAVLVIETQEQAQIAREVAGFLAPVIPLQPQARRIPVAVSGRHVHLSGAAVAALFGPGRDLTPARALRQPGNWLAVERVALEGPDGRLDHVAILGPLRNRTQIEISRTDAHALGIDAPVRDSGDLDGTPRLRLVGPAGTLETDGVIVAARHIHISPDAATELGLSDGVRVALHIGSAQRGLTLEQVLVRVQPNAFTEAHIDTDEANAAGLDQAEAGTLIEGGARVENRPEPTGAAGSTD